MILHLVKRLVLILLGYGAASLASGAVVTGAFLWSASLKHTEPLNSAVDLLPIFLIITLLIAIYAAIPAAIFVAAGEYRPIRDLRYYALAGMVIGAVLPLVVFIEYIVIAVGLAFGPVAGAIYWRIAGRNAGLRPAFPGPAARN